MSLDGVELLVALEEAFGVTLDDEAVARVVTVRDLCELVIGSLGPHAQLDPTGRARVERRVVEVICEQQGLEPRVVVPDARLGDDLGID